jgi:hypothetical protein
MDFDYLKGRVIKVNLSGDEIDPWGYDRDNGQGAVEEIVSILRQTGEVYSEEAEIRHKEGTRNQAIFMDEHVDDPNYVKHQGDTFVYGLGTSDLSHLIRPKIKKVLNDED